MHKKIKELEKIMDRFQPLIKNPKMTYSFIAPKEDKKYNEFIQITSGIPSESLSLYEILSDNKIVQEILLTYFKEETVLEIYIATKDIGTPIIIKGTLNEYIRTYNISFSIK